jgi:arylsulfatase A-like enzyme
MATARRGVGGVLLLLVLASGVPACAPDPPPRFERVVLVSIDTLRRDHLGVYGYPRDTSPFIDSLAREGVTFERAYAPMPTTAPSHATIFTSLYPVQHGVRSNGQQLPDGVETLAERLRNGGFVTAGFTSTRAQWVPTGLGRGFDAFHARAIDDPEVYRRADRTVDAALEWLAACEACERLFLFVHLFDPHGPLHPPEIHLDVFRGEGPEARARHAAYLAEEQGIPLDFYRGDPGRLLFVVDRYDAEIRFADSELRRLQTGLVSALGDAPTLWVVTSDHGEGLGNHDFMGHGKAYEEGLRVPLIFHASDGSLPSRRVPGIVQHVDIAPTLLALTGQAPLSDVTGASLERSLLGAGSPPGGPALAERGRIAVGPELRRLPQEDPGDVSGEQFAWIEERFKYLHHTTGEDELYDLRADPHEKRNLLVDGPSQESQRLADALRIELESLPRRVTTPEAVELDAQTRAELRALGYAP